MHGKHDDNTIFNTSNNNNNNSGFPNCQGVALRVPVIKGNEKSECWD